MQFCCFLLFRRRDPLLHRGVWFMERHVLNFGVIQTATSGLAALRHFAVYGMIGLRPVAFAGLHSFAASGR